jgi:hypothetical protein
VGPLYVVAKAILESNSGGFLGSLKGGAHLFGSTMKGEGWGPLLL